MESFLNNITPLILTYNEEDELLICYRCRLKYQIKDDIPVMLIDEAEKF